MKCPELHTTGLMGRALHKARRRYYKALENLQRVQKAARIQPYALRCKTTLRAERRAERAALARAAAVRAGEQWGSSDRELPPVVAFTVPLDMTDTTAAEALCFRGLRDVVITMVRRKRTLAAAGGRAISALQAAINTALHRSYVVALEAWQARNARVKNPPPTPTLGHTWAGRTVAEWQAWGNRMVAHLLLCLREHAQGTPVFELPSLHSALHGWLVIEGSTTNRVRLTNRLGHVAELRTTRTPGHPLALVPLAA
jgi:hypothetical protein